MRPANAARPVDPLAARHLVEQLTGELAHALVTVEDAPPGEQHDVLGDVALEVGLDVVLGRQSEVVVDDFLRGPLRQFVRHLASQVR